MARRLAEAAAPLGAPDQLRTFGPGAPAAPGRPPPAASPLSSLGEGRCSLSGLSATHEDVRQRHKAEATLLPPFLHAWPGGACDRHAARRAADLAHAAACCCASIAACVPTDQDVNKMSSAACVCSVRKGAGDTAHHRNLEAAHLSISAATRSRPIANATHRWCRVVGCQSPPAERQSGMRLLHRCVAQLISMQHGHTT